jgi:hypothetical protein
MKNPRIHLLVIAAWSVVLLIVAMQASPVKAGYPDECAGSADLGRTDVVGVPDVGFTAGGEPTVPKEMAVYRFTDLTGEHTLTGYWDGVGLTPPSDLYPLWLAPVEGPGMYFIIHDGNVCVVAVEASIEPQPSGGPLPSSDPGAPQADDDTIQIPKNVAFIGMGVLALLVIAGFLLSRRRTRHLATRQSPRSETV